MTVLRRTVQIRSGHMPPSIYKPSATSAVSRVPTVTTRNAANNARPTASSAVKRSRGNPMEIQSETLADEELAAITGYRRSSLQLSWLNQNGWKYVLTGARRPVVGRVYARMKLSGVKPSAENVVTEAWSLDLSRVG